MHCTGTGKIVATVTVLVNLLGTGEDLDDCYGPASTDLNDIRNSLEQLLEDVGDTLVRYYTGAASFRLSDVESVTVGIEQPEFLSFDNSGEADTAYDSWRDRGIV